MKEGRGRSVGYGSCSGGADGLEQNTMAILDNCGFANSNSSHHLNEDRRTFLEAVRTTFLLADHGTRPSRNIFDAIFHILREEDSFDVAMESYELLLDLDKRFPRVSASKEEETYASSNSRDTICNIVLNEGAWQPFNFGSDSSDDKGDAKSHLQNSLDFSGVQGLVQEIAEVTKNLKPEEVEKASLKLLLFQYLISVLEGDFWPRNSTYRANMNWILVRESLLNTLLVSRKIIFKTLMKDCISILSNLSNWSLISEKASSLEKYSGNLSNGNNGVIFLTFPEVKRSTCSFLRKLFIMVMELDSSWKLANDHGLTTRADRLRTPVVDIILDELIYDSGLLCTFLHAFDCAQRLEIIVQYFQKYKPKSSVQTRRSNAAINALNFEAVLKWFCDLTSTRNILRKLSSDTVQLLLSYAFQAYLATLYNPVSKGLSLPDVKNKASEVCRNISSAFVHLRQEHPNHELVERGREALFAAGVLLSHH